MIKEVKKVPKIFIAFLMLFLMMISYFAPVTKVFAASNTNKLSISFRENSLGNGKVQYSLNDGANWFDVTGNISNQNISVTGDNLRIKIVPNDGYEVDYAGIDLKLDDVVNSNISNYGFEESDGFRIAANVKSVSLERVEFREKIGNLESQFNSSATINYIVNGFIEYNIGGCETGICFMINNTPYQMDNEKATFTEGIVYEVDEYGEVILDDNNNPIPVKDPDTAQPMKQTNGVTVTGDTMNYNAETDKVTFTFYMSPGNLMTNLKINGEVIGNLPSTDEELVNYYTDHRIEIDVNNITKADTYNIEIEARYPTSNEEFLGNFLWDYNPNGYTAPDDKILHGTLTFVKAQYDNNIYATVDQINELGGVYVWKDAVRKSTYVDEREGLGEAQFPKGTILTVKIIPDAGYQLVSFGLNGFEFEPQEELGTYTFEVAGGPFHLQAEIAKIDASVAANSMNIKSGNIDINTNFQRGTAKLEVNDVVSLSPERVENFEAIAEEKGYKLQNYLNISLYNSVYKGGKKDIQGNFESWDTPIDNLTESATITLELEDDIIGKDVVLIHETHDGSTVTGYEIVNATYNKKDNTITFETDSFSNYAIATRGSVEQAKYTVESGNITLMFTDDQGYAYQAEIINILDLNDEELELIGVNREEFDLLLTDINSKISSYGSLLQIYAIDVNDGFKSYTGNTNIKIKLDDKMKKYNTFKMIYIDEDNNFKLGDVVDLKVDGDYLVGTLPHLSVYALVGSYEKNPKTGDNILLYIFLGTISVIGILGSAIIFKKVKMTSSI